MPASTATAGIVVLDKPAGVTSNRATRRVQRLFGARAAGHLGTLDPFATGVLPVMLDEATRLAPLLEGGAKTYLAEIALGIATDTLDRDGEIVSRRPVPADAIDLLAAAIPAMTGCIRQAVPAYSAAKVAGVRRCDLARDGREAPPTWKDVEIASIRIVGAAPPRVTIEVVCGPGTYVRQLVADLGEAIGCGAHAAALRRTRSGRFRVEDAVTLEQVEGVEAPDRHCFPADLRGSVPGPVLEVAVEALDALSRGRPFDPGPACAGLRDGQTVLAASGGSLRAITVFRSGLVHPRRWLGPAGVPLGGVRSAVLSYP
ncbi:MAG: tRNA pseudouridine(55) synthase TruB [Myxococcota bacterium]|nr:tRNA pseudouridine(55) synthase TruB [Myxococcota bacterium]